MKNPGSTMRTRGEWVRCAALSLGCALLFLISTPASRGDSSVQQGLPPDIVFATYPLMPGTESFGPVLADAISYRLISKGLAVRLEPGVPSAAELEAKSRLSGAAIALSCRYSVVGSQMAISFLWNDLQKGTPPVVREGKGPLDLTLGLGHPEGLRRSALAGPRESAGAGSAAAGSGTGAGERSGGE